MNKPFVFSTSSSGRGVGSKSASNTPSSSTFSSSSLSRDIPSNCLPSLRKKAPISSFFNHPVLQGARPVTMAAAAANNVLIASKPPLSSSLPSSSLPPTQSYNLKRVYEPISLGGDDEEHDEDFEDPLAGTRTAGSATATATVQDVSQQLKQRPQQSSFTSNNNRTTATPRSTLCSSIHSAGRHCAPFQSNSSTRAVARKSSTPSNMNGDFVFSNSSLSKAALSKSKFGVASGEGGNGAGGGPSSKKFRSSANANNNNNVQSLQQQLQKYRPLNNSTSLSNQSSLYSARSPQLSNPASAVSTDYISSSTKYNYNNTSMASSTPSSSTNLKSIQPQKSLSNPSSITLQLKLIPEKRDPINMSTFSSSSSSSTSKKSRTVDHPIPNHSRPSENNTKNNIENSNPKTVTAPPSTNNRNKSSKYSSSSSNMESLSQEQLEVLQIVTKQRKNIFFTGSAGTGKSFLLRQIIKEFRKNLKYNEVAVTAPTGLAACNIDGVTLHSFAGVGLGTGTSDQLVIQLNNSHKYSKKNKTGKTAKERWISLKVLIIDEVSMLDGKFFDKLEHVARIIRCNSQPFGGIQLVLSGDFMQLPPVAKDGNQIHFAFEAQAWTNCIYRNLFLKKIFRQGNDPEFIAILNEMRVGQLSARSICVLQALSRPLNLIDNIEPPQLFSRRDEVERANQRKLESIQAETRVFKSSDTGDVQKLDSNSLAPRELALKLDAQVMLVKNLDKTFVNGAVGKVVGFNEESGYPIVSFNLKHGLVEEREICDEAFSINDGSGAVIAQRIQVPLILAWAISIHKSQGQTLDRLIVDMGKIFEVGQAYVAISRCTSMRTLQVLNFSVDKVRVHPKVVQFYARFE